MTDGDVKMSRSDGEFPLYTKLDYNVDDPPEGWNQGCRRCATCKKNWPNIPGFSPSPCCNYQTGIVADGTPDMSWQDAYRELMNFRFDRFYEKYNEGASDVELCWNSNERPSEQEISEGLDKLNSLISEMEEEETHGKIK